MSEGERIPTPTMSIPSSGARPGLPLILGGLLGLLLAAYLAFGSIGDMRQARASASWPTVRGEVTTFAHEQTRRPAADISRDPGPSNVRRETRQSLDWAYTYAVDGQTYTGRRAAWGGADRRGLYAMGDEVTVHYDPDNPATAILHPDSAPASRTGAVLALLCIGGAMVYGGFSAQRQALAA